jgi:hypothetical protein
MENGGWVQRFAQNPPPTGITSSTNDILPFSVMELQQTENLDSCQIEQSIPYLWCQSWCCVVLDFG